MCVTYTLWSEPGAGGLYLDLQKETGMFSVFPGSLPSFSSMLT